METMTHRRVSAFRIFGLLLLTRCAPLSAPSEPQTSVVTSTSITAPKMLIVAPTETVRLLTPTMTPMPTISPPVITPIGVPGAQSNGFSYAPSISAGGRYVAFESLATNLVPDDTNRVSDIFVYDRQGGITERVSVTSDGIQANRANSRPSISADGRWVVFTSEARNLVPDDTNRVSDIFVYDRKTSATKRISVDSDGAQSNNMSYAPTISADGRYVAFVSKASNLVPDDTNRQPDVFVHDRQTKQTKRVNVSNDGRQADGWSDWPSISADGRFIAFGSSATNLTAEATGGIFVHDRQRGTTEWLGAGFAPTISDNGRWVAFLVRDGTDDWIFLFLYDRQTDTSVRIHRIVEGIHGKPGKEISISRDGRWIAFWAVASDPTTGAPKKHTDVFVYDRRTGTTDLVSVASDGTPGNSGSGSPSISADGRWVAFDSSASNLIIDDKNGFSDVFVRDRLTGKTEPLTITIIGNDSDRNAGVFHPSNTPAATSSNGNAAESLAILFTRDGKLWHTNLEGSDQDQLGLAAFYQQEVGLWFHQNPPRVSPDGQYMVVPTTRGTWVVDVHSDERWRLRGDPALVTWSPDSERVAYVRQDVLYLLSVHPNAPAQSLFSPVGENILDRAVAWSCCSDGIAAVSTVTSGTKTLSTVWLVTSQTGDAHALGKYEIAATEYGPEALQWSPSGEHLLYTLPVSGAVVFSPEEGTTTLLPDAYDDSAWWSPDSNYLFSPGLGAVIHRDGGTHISLLTPSPRGPRVVAWAWSETGRKLAYAVLGQNRDGKLHWLDLEDSSAGGNIDLGIGLSYPPQSLFWVQGGTALIMDDGQPRTPIWRWELGQPTAQAIVQDGFLLDLIPQAVAFPNE